MTRIIFNVFICLGMVVGTLAFVCAFRVMYHAKDPRHWHYGAFLYLRPDLLTAKGRRLLAWGWLCSALFVFAWFVCFCLAHTPAMRKP